MARTTGWLFVEMKSEPTRATTTAITIAATVSSIVKGNCSAKMSLTLRCWAYEVPRSPQYLAQVSEILDDDRLIEAPLANDLGTQLRVGALGFRQQIVDDAAGRRRTAMNVRVTALHTTTTACATRARRNRPTEASRARRSCWPPARTFLGLVAEGVSERINCSSIADEASGWEDTKVLFSWRMCGKPGCLQPNFDRERRLLKECLAFLLADGVRETRK